MSTKYLGAQFDIHGGGMDLKFPHHECEVAQGTALNGKEPVRYWMHANMLTVNGQKMSKSLGNSFLPGELFSGNHPLLSQAYSPMTVRFFMLQSHYRSTLDFSNEALQAAGKGYRRLMNSLRITRNLQWQDTEETAADQSKIAEIEKATDGFIKAMSDDLNTAVAIAELFSLMKHINMLQTGQLKASALGKDVFVSLKTNFIIFVTEILGLKEEDPKIHSLIPGLLELYRGFKESKQYDKVDEIRGIFKNAGLVIRDLKTSLDWAYDEQ
jgi:cysteinyl-tRNA synthetase